MFDAFTRNNNAKLKLWHQKYIKQKLKYKVKWKNSSSYRETVLCFFQNLKKETVKKSFKYIVNLNSNQETRPNDRSRALY